MEQLLQTLVNGLTSGALYVCLAVGFTLIFGVIQLIYFAQCEMAMLGAFAFAGCYVVLAPWMPLWLTIVISLGAAALGVAFTSFLAERLFLSPIRTAPKIKGLIVSLGLSIVFQNVVFLLVSPSELPFPLSSRTKWSFSGCTLTDVQCFVIVLSLLTWSLVALFLQRTRHGRAIRAVAQAHDGALLMGIDVNRMVSLTFVIAAISATVAGILMGVYYSQLKFDMGFLPGVKGFTVAILGGVGNIRGVLLAGFLMGIGETFFAGYLSTDYKDVFAFILLISVLVFRPRGLLGEGA